MECEETKSNSYVRAMPEYYYSQVFMYIYDLLSYVLMNVIDDEANMSMRPRNGRYICLYSKYDNYYVN